VAGWFIYCFEISGFDVAILFVYWLYVERAKYIYIYIYSKTSLKRSLKGPEHFPAKARFPFNQGTLHIKIKFKQVNQRTTKEKENKPDLTFQILLK
jgi:hypothetical protein